MQKLTLIQRWKCTVFKGIEIPISTFSRLWV